MHSLSHTSEPVAQHRPLEHVSPESQALPQAPQLFPSVKVLLHEPPQQTWSSPHTLPHAPQLSESVSVLMEQSLMGGQFVKPRPLHVHVLAPLAEVPWALHGVHSPAAAPAYVLAGQVEHLVDPQAAAVPAEQVTQATAFLAYVPAGHFVHSAAAEPEM